MPNFGNETETSYKLSKGGKLVGSHFTCPEAGTADSVSFYGSGGYYAAYGKAAIYKHSDNSKVAETEKVWLNPTQWYTFNFADPKPTLEAIEYWLLISFCGGGYIFYDEGVMGNGGYQTANCDALPDPFVPTLEPHIYCIYCTYTTGAPPSVPKIFGDGLTWTVTAMRKAILSVVGLPFGVRR